METFLYLSLLSSGDYLYIVLKWRDTYKSETCTWRLSLFFISFFDINLFFLSLPVCFLFNYASPSYLPQKSGSNLPILY